MQFEFLLRLCEHINRPSADNAIRAAADDVVCILRADNFEAIYGMSMPKACQWRFLDWIW